MPMRRNSNVRFIRYADIQTRLARPAQDISNRDTALSHPARGLIQQAPPFFEERAGL